VNEANLDSVKLLHIVNDDHACFGNTELDERIRACGDADAELLPRKPSGQNDARETLPLSAAREGRELIFCCATSHAACCLDTLRPRPAFSLRTCLRSAKT